MLTFSGMALFKKLADVWRSGASDSYLDFNAVANVEPIVLVDNTLLNEPVLADVLQTNLAFFAGQYLMAATLSMSVGKINIRNHLDKLNPNRKAVDIGNILDSAGDWAATMEAEQHRLPDFGNRLSVEAYDEVPETGATGGRDQLKEIHDASNMAVGKLLSFEITDGQHRQTVHVGVRLNVKQISAPALLSIYNFAGKDQSAKERYWGWRGGDLSFIRDIVFCVDVLDEYRDTLMKDDTGIYANILKRHHTNRFAGIVTANPSVATSSNMLVIDSTTTEALENEIMGKLDNFKTRQKIFAESYLMTIAVVDRGWNQVTFYHRGISVPTTCSFKEIASKTKADNFNITDILSSYQAGSHPKI